jgi:hypothetical protein
MVLHVLMLSIVERSGLEAEHSYVEGYFTFLKVAIDSFEISALGRELTRRLFCHLKSNKAVESRITSNSSQSPRDSKSMIHRTFNKQR